jgi:phosphohistidine swiveling domain-containing protein
MSTLWLKFSQEATLPAQLSLEEEAKLDQVYDPADETSVWSQALAALGLKRRPAEKLLRFHKGQPYVNWSLMVAMLGCGWITPVPAENETGFVCQSRTALLALPRLLSTQWRIAQYIERKLAPDCPLPQENTAQLVESTALGIALQALLLRLPHHTPQEFARWLAAPDKTPLAVRKTMMQVQALQKRRTQLSSAWHRLFPPRAAALEEEMHALPESFWDEPPEQGPKPDVVALDSLRAQAWTGLPVCAGQVTGMAVPVRNLAGLPAMDDPSAFPIFIFPRARPETVELFGAATGLLYAEGGALSHACTVAREQGIPCITGLGPEFLYKVEAQLEKGKAVWLTMDGMTGEVTLVDTSHAG